MAYTLDKEAREGYLNWVRMNESIKRIKRQRPISEDPTKPLPKIWGSQELMNPISKSVFKYDPSERLVALSKPKKIWRPASVIQRRNNGPGRASMITPVSKGALKYEISERMTEMSKPRPINNYYCTEIYRTNTGRPSLMTDIPPGALTCPERPHTTALAQPKGLNPDFEHDVLLANVGRVPYRSLTAHCPAHIVELAQPRMIEEETGKPIQDARAINMERIEKLAVPRGLHQDFLADTPITPVDEELLPIQTNVLKAAVSRRIQEMSTPIIKNKQPGINMAAFVVSRAALSCKTSPRMEELSKPIIRD